jgi:hypothetical protein
MNVREWFDQNKDTDEDEDGETGDIAFVIESEGRGEACLEDIGEGRYGASITDEHLSQAHQKPGESKATFNARVEEESGQATFSGEDDIEVVVEWFADQIGYSAADKAEIIRHWKEQSGMA